MSIEIPIFAPGIGVRTSVAAQPAKTAATFIGQDGRNTSFSGKALTRKEPAFTEYPIPIISSRQSTVDLSVVFASSAARNDIAPHSVVRTAPHARHA